MKKSEYIPPISYGLPVKIWKSYKFLDSYMKTGVGGKVKLASFKKKFNSSHTWYGNSKLSFKGIISLLFDNNGIKRTKSKSIFIVHIVDICWSFNKRSIKRCPPIID